MRRLLPRVTIACAAFVIGTFAGSVHQHLFTKRPVDVDLPAPTAPPPPITPPLVKEEYYPEDAGIGPRDIEFFIEQHPHANLTRLWERLGVRGQKSNPFDWGCNNCTAQVFDYNLDDDPDREIVLRIADPMSEAYRYLVFKFRAGDEMKLLGHVDARGKYRPSSHAVFLSGGKAWLVIEGQSANGSGLAAYDQTVYRVSSRGVQPVLSYYSEIYESGFGLMPEKSLVAHLVSIEVQGGRVKGTVSCTVEYSVHDGSEAKPFFKKQQTAVLLGYGDGSVVVDAATSDITPHEFETIFNFDSMGKEEFLNYNRSELRAIAAGRDRMKKEWLKDYLETCENSSIRRELTSLLR